MNENGVTKLLFYAISITQYVVYIMSNILLNMYCTCSRMLALYMGHRHWGWRQAWECVGNILIYPTEQIFFHGEYSYPTDFQDIFGVLPQSPR